MPNPYFQKIKDVVLHGLPVESAEDRKKRLKRKKLKYTGQDSANKAERRQLGDLEP